MCGWWSKMKIDNMLIIICYQKWKHTVCEYSSGHISWYIFINVSQALLLIWMFKLLELKSLLLISLSWFINNAMLINNAVLQKILNLECWMLMLKKLSWFFMSVFTLKNWRGKPWTCDALCWKRWTNLYSSA